MSGAAPSEDLARLEERRRILLEEQRLSKDELKMLGSILKGIGEALSVGRWPNDETLSAYPSVATLKALVTKVVESTVELAKIDRQINLSSHSVQRKD